MDSNEDEDGSQGRITCTTGPAYAVGGYGLTDTNGVHCSAVDEFCFFCTYEKNTDAVGSDADLYGNLVELAETMTGLKREPVAIAHHIAAAYRRTVQGHVPGQPNWSVDSVLRHLLYSGSFNPMFEAGVTAMFTSLIARQNSALVDTSTNIVIEDNRRAFCNTIDTFVRWQNRKR
jgi:hypothetical protein